MNSAEVGVKGVMEIWTVEWPVILTLRGLTDTTDGFKAKILVI